MLGRSWGAGLAAMAVPGLPEIDPGADLVALVEAAGARPTSDQVVVISHKVVSKAEGRVVALGDVTAGPRARELGAELGGDARAIQVVLDESVEVLRAQRGVLISRTRHGFVCANAGVDASNTAAPDSLVLLPLDPDASARSLRARWRELTGRAPAIVIADSFGRAWRHGQCEVAIGCAGLAPLEDWRGRHDSVGRRLRATWIAVADQAACSADLVRAKDSREPVVLLTGLGRHVTDENGPGVAALIRPLQEDMFR